MISVFLDRLSVLSARLATPRGIALVFAVYGLLFCLVRIASGGALVSDEIHENILTQSLEGGYAFRNPPLYEWIVWTVQQVTGPRVISFLLVKYGFLTLTAVLYFLLARWILRDARWAFLATLSILLLYHVGWDYHRMFSHTAVLMAAMPFAFLAFLRLIDRRRPVDYALAGLALGIGLLSKYLFALFAVSMIAAFLTRREGRAALINPWSGLSAAVMMVVIAPHGLWLLKALGEFTAVSSAYIAGESGYFERAAKGAAGLVYAPLAFLSPFVIFALLCFPAAFRPLGRKLDVEAIFLERTMTVSFAVLLAGVLAGAVGNIKERYMFAFLFLAPIYIFARIAQITPQRSRVRIYGVILTGVIAVAFLLRVGEGVAGPPFCSSCDHLAPYKPAVAALKEMGAEEGTIIAADFHTAGNLRRFFPETRVTSPHLVRHAPYAPPRVDDSRCFFVWRLDLLNNAAPADAAATIGASEYLEDVKIVEAPWGGVGRPRGWRTARWGIARLDPAAPACGQIGANGG